ncbi:unnamed protein product [Euphydryas editha]|uniref:Transposase n=1 Tax=Euphydryas editha TaxID=104508 RepID=A0AAU9TKG5_EUPED|nr:unnamed protein product [Euphydryas editha]
MLERTERDPNFFEKILWTDESRFERTGVFNIHNYHSWAIENPHMARPSNFQTRFSVNLWLGIVNGTLIGPFELPNRLNGAQYLEFLQNDLDDLLEDVDLYTRRRIIFQNDGAPCYYTKTVREHLDQSTIPQKVDWTWRADSLACTFTRS